MQRYAGRPFVVLGVNLDAERQAVERNRRPWPSIWDEGGHNARRWGVSGLPAVYLLDAHGVVRFRSPGPPAHEVIERKIEELLREVR